MSDVTPGRTRSRREFARRQWVTLVTGSMAGFMIGLDATGVTTALPTLRAGLHASISTLG
jgi:hypothetical protein